MVADHFEAQADSMTNGEANNGRLKIIHIVENLDRGAVENWLVRMLRHAREKGVECDWTFYCALGRAGELDGEVRNLGAQVIYSPEPIGRKWAFVRALRKVLIEGRYEVLHGHHDLISAVYLAAALGLPLRKRLVHVHNADEAVLSPSRLKKRLLRPFLRQTCLRLADGIIGISNHTLATFLAGQPRRAGRDRVHYYGIDPTPFLATRAERSRFRKTLGLPEAAKLVLFAGRLVREKNPLFAVEVFAEMHRRDSQVAAVFIGAGSMEQAVIEKARELGLGHSFRALGWRSDVAEIMTCCDWFILPRPEHPMEGLGIAVVEAQLAGLRLLLSRGVADDPLLPGSVWARLGLADGAEHWAEEALRLQEQQPPSAQQATVQLAKSPFDMDFALADLLDLYN